MENLVHRLFLEIGCGNWVLQKTIHMKNKHKKSYILHYKSIQFILKQSKNSTSPRTNTIFDVFAKKFWRLNAKNKDTFPKNITFYCTFDSISFIEILDDENLLCWQNSGLKKFTHHLSSYNLNHPINTLWVTSPCFTWKKCALHLSSDVRISSHVFVK